MLRNPGFFRGLVLEGPLIRLPSATQNPFLHALAKLGSWILPEVPTESISVEAVTSDLEMQDKISSDPLRVKGGVKLGMVVAMLDSISVRGFSVGVGRDLGIVRAVVIIDCFINFGVHSIFVPSFPDSTRRGNKWKRGHNDCFKMH